VEDFNFDSWNDDDDINVDDVDIVQPPSDDNTGSAQSATSTSTTAVKVDKVAVSDKVDSSDEEAQRLKEQTQLAAA